MIGYIYNIAIHSFFWIGVGVLLGKYFAKRRQQRLEREKMLLEKARETLPKIREWLEARFVSYASEKILPYIWNWETIRFGDDAVVSQERRSRAILAYFSAVVELQPPKNREREEPFGSIDFIPVLPNLKQAMRNLEQAILNLDQSTGQHDPALPGKPPRSFLSGSLKRNVVVELRYDPKTDFWYPSGEVFFNQSPEDVVRQKRCREILLVSPHNSRVQTYVLH